MDALNLSNLSITSHLVLGLGGLMDVVDCFFSLKFSHCSTLNIMFVNQRKKQPKKEIISAKHLPIASPKMQHSDLNKAKFVTQ